MKIAFTKMHGEGNDYIYLNCLQGQPENPSLLAKLMSPRHFAVGADGLVLICKSEVADARMRMFNADGSEGNMCGNAIRCVGKYLYDIGFVNNTELTIETKSGIKKLSLIISGGKVDSVKVDMGFATFSADSGFFRTEVPAINIDFPIGGKKYKITCVSVGNPHCVVPVRDAASFEVSNVGPLFESNPFFTNGVNTEFVQYVDRTTLIMRVWERGSGETLACGTGASAVTAAYCKLGLCDYNVPVCVNLLGGKLFITVTPENRVFMTGGAVKTFEGVFEYEN